MKQLNTRFILSNIVTAIMLVVLMPYYRDQAEITRVRGSSPVYAYLLLLTVIVGMLAMNVKSYELARRSVKRLKWYGNAFLVVTYIGALLSNWMILSEAERLGNLTGEKGPVMLLVLALMVYSLVSVVLESHFLQNRPKFQLPEQWTKLADKISISYASIGINLCWFHVVLRMEIHKMSVYASLPLFILLMFFFVFSFERLFWYEIMHDSETKRDNLKTFLVILLVMAAGIVPMYVG